jgi:hypothetical protein
MLLCQVTEADDDDRCKDLGDGRIDVKLLYKELDKDIVE